MKARVYLAAGSLVLLIACKPDLGKEGSIISDVRFIAVQSEPAESLPGEEVSFHAVLVGPRGPIQNPTFEWSYCLVPKSLDENNVVSDACLEETPLLSASAGAISAAIPSEACQLFGPDPPPQEPGKPPLRPRDPDSTGGYFQPLRVRQGQLTVFKLQRVTCNLARASTEVAADFRRRYHGNKNPHIAGLVAGSLAGAVNLKAVPRGAEIWLKVSWPAETAEIYPVYDVASQMLTDQRESLRVSWYATQGSFTFERTSRRPDEPETYSENQWTAPNDAGLVWIWVVLRDNRGGSDIQHIQVTVLP